MQHQGLYECIHRFLDQSRWISVVGDGNNGGCTWLELFAMFDGEGWRTNNAQYHLDRRAEKRAKTRAAKVKAARRRKATPTNIANCSIKPSLNRELANSKAIVRYIVNSDASTEV